MLTFDWENDLEPLSRRIAAEADKHGSVAPETIFDLLKSEVLRAAQRSFAKALDDKAKAPFSTASSLSLAGVDLNLLNPHQSLRALKDSFNAKAKSWFRRSTGLDSDDVANALSAAADQLRRAAEEVGEGVIDAVAQIDQDLDDIARRLDDQLGDDSE